MNTPKASIVGAGKPRMGEAYLVMDADTGELFAAVSLVEWERLAADARELDPCQPTDRGGHMTNCSAPGCELARRVLKLAREVES